MSKQSYLDYIQNRYGIASEGMLTDFLSRGMGGCCLQTALTLAPWLNATMRHLKLCIAR